MAGRIGAAFEALDIDRAAFEKEQDRLVRGILGAATGAVRDVTKQLERDLEDLTKRHVKGRLWRAWTSQAYPRTGIAREPTGEVFVKQRWGGGGRSIGAMQFFTQRGRIRAKQGRYLAIPTPAAGGRGTTSRGVYQDLTPEDFERKTGAKLRFVYRRTGPSLLVLDEGRLAGKKQLGRQIGARSRGKGRGATIVIFILVPQVAFANRFAIDPTVKQAQGKLLGEFVSRAKRVS